MKPKHQGGYPTRHTELCEQTLVTLLRGLGDWKHGITVIGGLVPRYLIPAPSGESSRQPHIGTTDVDLVLDLDILATIEAYQRLEQQLQALGFRRGTNDDGQAQHFSWRRPVGEGMTIVVDLLCDDPQTKAGGIVPLPGERRLSAISIPGAHLAGRDHVEIELTVPLLDERGIATEKVRIAAVTPFLVLKALAYENRFEEKDAYDLIYCLMYFPGGPDAVARIYADKLATWPDEPLLLRALAILRDRFSSDDTMAGARKDGPTSYARFLADPGRRELDARHRQDAASVVERFLAGIPPLPT